ncbi:lysine N(6)-hydroxylase/L-ornithine N(5)-oxygenase family protein [Chromobacterium vaccinii]|uniref:lysine N(6)-hydroxylase/L-ornithine N(5)-oxygenase family protein n=1 Tax=Chromobacterium vaccinii TaxID=1108595 RepID=UPI003C77DD37
MNTRLDVAGIGVGPFNLSVAALLAPLSELKTAFFERRPAFNWHPGMMLAGTRLQTSFLKDLVTSADPTSRYSFLAYLVAQGRFYRFINAEFPRIERREFADYLRWVAEQLPNLRFGSEIREVRHNGERFVLQFADQTVEAEQLVVATGNVPHVPDWGAPHLGEQALHASQYMTTPFSAKGKRVVVVGGGQSGAEIVLDLMAGNRGEAASITLLSRRPTLEPLDESPFTNEFFTPEYVGAFHQLPQERKAAIVERQKLASDGISPDTLRQLTQAIYVADFLSPDNSRPSLLPFREVCAMRRDGKTLRLTMHNGFDGQDEQMDADLVIFATGYRSALPSCLAPLSERLRRDRHGRLALREDFSAEWDGPADQRLFFQNAGRLSHGIADPQLSLAAWRSAVIVNSLLGRRHYNDSDAATPLNWTAPQTAPASSIVAA